MPGEWQYHGDGVQTAVSTTHDLDGTLTDVRVQLDCFKFRTWTEAEVEEHPSKEPEHLSWDDRREVYEEFADGAHATLRFDVEDGVASLMSVKPEDDDVFRPDHVPLFRSAERVLDRLDGVLQVENPIDRLASVYDDAAGIHIDKLDG